MAVLTFRGVKPIIAIGTLNLPASSIVSLNTALTIPSNPPYTYGGFLTDHNRSELDVSYDEIGNTDRSAVGTMRGYVVTRKRTFSTSWDMVPAEYDATVDGGWSGNELLTFYNTLSNAACTLFIYNRDKAITAATPQHTVNVRFKDFSYTVVKRSVKYKSTYTDYWNFDASWEEI